MKASGAKLPLVEATEVYSDEADVTKAKKPGADAARVK